MPMVTTPDGRQIFVPDFLAPAFPQDPALTPPAPVTPEEASFALANRRDDQAKAGHADYLAWQNSLPAGRSELGYQRGHARAVTDSALAAGQAPPRTDIARIAQATGPIGTIGQIGQNVDPTAQPPPPRTPEWSAADTANLQALTPPAPAKPLTPAQKKQQAQQAAYQASPEGQIQQAGAEGQGALADRGAIAQAQGDVEAAELGEVAKLGEEGLANQARVRAEADKEIAVKKQMVADATTKIEELNKQEADVKIDENRKWKEMGTGRTIGFWIAAALSGLGDALARKSGPNMVLGMMEKAIENDVAAQVRERDQIGKRIGYARNSLDTYRQQLGDAEAARQAKVAESWDAIAKQTEVVASRYGSEKAKLRGADLAAQMRGMAAAIRGQTAEQMAEREYKAQQVALERSRVAQGWSNIKLERDKLDFTKETTDKELKLRAAALDKEGKGAEAALVQKQGVVLPPTAAVGADGSVTMQQGETVILPAVTEKEIPEVRAKMITANRALQITDELRQIVNDSSGAGRKVGSWLGSPEQKRVDVLVQQLVAMQKANMTGMSSDADMSRLEKMVGVKSINDLRGGMDALNEAREQQIKGIQTTLQGYGLPPEKAPKWADPIKAAAPMTPEQGDARRLEATRYSTMDPKEIAKQTGGTISGSAPLAGQTQGMLAKQEAGILPRDKQAIDTWAAVLASPSSSRKEKETAASILGNLATKAQDPAIRAYAAQIGVDPNAPLASPPAEELAPAVR